ncbi:hypothetical protein B0H14DRAFT_2641181 [Mycena olivaceomarginata]|nr:hypothetical protein B0H14DRAFT_2641181 [Mycena olivaceomarginata]
MAVVFMATSPRLAYPFGLRRKASVDTWFRFQGLPMYATCRALLFFRRVALPSQQCCVLAASTRTIALSTSSRLPHIAATHANGWLKSRRPSFLNTRSYRPSSKIIVFPTRCTVHDQSALYYTLLAFIFDAPVPPRRTDFSPHIPSLPYDTRLYRPALSAVAHPHQPCLPTPLCVSEAGAVNKAQWRARASWCANNLCVRAWISPPISTPYELWGIEAEWGRLAVELVGAISPRLIQSSGSRCTTTCLKGHLPPSARSWMGRQ